MTSGEGRVLVLFLGSKKTNRRRIHRFRSNPQAPAKQTRGQLAVGTSALKFERRATLKCALVLGLGYLRRLFSLAGCPFSLNTRRAAQSPGLPLVFIIRSETSQRNEKKWDHVDHPDKPYDFTHVFHGLKRIKKWLIRCMVAYAHSRNKRYGEEGRGIGRRRPGLSLRTLSGEDPDGRRCCWLKCVTRSTRR